MPRKRLTGEGQEYTPSEEAVVARALQRGQQHGADALWVGKGTEVEWAGVATTRRNGTRLDGLNLSATNRALDALERAQPATSRRAQGWHAQLRELTASQYGRTAAADRAGLSPSARTLRAWLAETQTPSAANQARIRQAYSELANRSVIDAERRVTDALTVAIRERYGSTVRFRNVSSLRME